MNITLEQFRKTIPTNQSPEKWYEAFPAFCKKYDLSTRNRVAGFLAQGGHESMDMRVVEENLNYSAAGLMKTFGRYFTSATQAQQFHRQPEKIANYVYDDRHPKRTNKLGNIYDGDGWKFRGGGVKQLTGRYNYTEWAKTLGMTADEAAAYIRTAAGALESAGWFWKKNNLNAYCDKDDIVGLTKAINGGTIGLADRTARYKTAKAVLPATIDLGDVVITDPVVPVKPAPNPAPGSDPIVAKLGDRGTKVASIQTALRLLPADGIFGKNTKAAVESWQRSNRFTVTGEVTHTQFDKMLGL